MPMPTRHHHHGHHGGGAGGGSLSSKYSVVFLAVVICILNLYMYLGPRSPRSANDASLATGPGGMERRSGSSLATVDGRRQQETLTSSSSAAAKASVATPYAGKPNPFAAGPQRRDPNKKKNVLFIMTDDLRPSLSVYDKPVITPGFERLAKGGVVFERAYNQDPICNPSRNSMLSGRRPDTTRVWLFENTVPHDYSNIFRYFKDEGKYGVYGTGKLWHWTATWLEDFKNEYFPPSTDAWNQGTDENYPLMNASVQPDNVMAEERYWDYRIATEGIKLMQEAAEKKDEEPFFLAVGFHQPHRPWHMPLKYWDLYDDMPIPPTPHTTWPIDAPTVATGDINPMEIGMLPNSEKRYWANPDGGVGMDAILENVRGYHASVSFLDHQLQRLLDEVERLKLVDDTIIVFCVDHGMNIGDHGMWDKRTLFETNARVPLIIRDPDYPESFGTNASALAENVDIFPTLIEMANLPDPTNRLFPPLEGKSLVPVLKDPKGTIVKDFAMTQIARCCTHCLDVPVEEVPWQKWEVCRGGNWEWNQLNDRVYMGYSMRMDDWRYTAWVPYNSSIFSPMWDKELGGEELYDHRDPRCNEKGNFDMCETRNVAKDASLKEIKDELYAKLRSIVDVYNLQEWERQRDAAVVVDQGGNQQS